MRLWPKSTGPARGIYKMALTEIQPGETGQLEFSKTTTRRDRFYVGGAGRRVDLQDPTVYQINGITVDEEMFNRCRLAAVDAQSARCRSCGAPIFWRRLHTNPNGRPNPINMLPDRGGN